MQVSTGFAASLRGRAVALIRDGGFLDAVRKLLACAPVVHADETFARADGAPAYVHVACTEHLTLVTVSSLACRSGRVLDGSDLDVQRLGHGPPTLALCRPGHVQLRRPVGRVRRHRRPPALLLLGRLGVHEAGRSAVREAESTRRSAT